MATRTYEKDDLTVFWDSTRCIHTGICLRSLHSVFNFENRPWVNLDGGDVEQIIATVEKCPTGALPYQNRWSERVPRRQSQTGHRVPRPRTLLAYPFCARHVALLPSCAIRVRRHDSSSVSEALRLSCNTPRSPSP